VTPLYVGIGGFLGAIARYLIDGWVTARAGTTFPWGRSP
jgi:fluoride ion exporter CrcB/FEX